jgi:hypothetical protein
VLGERARLALRTDAGGRKRQKLLVLLAAYADAGETPTVRVLIERMGGDLPDRWHGHRVRRVDALLRSLEDQGLIRVDWRPAGTTQRNRYELLFADQLQAGRQLDPDKALLRALQPEEER